MNKIAQINLPQIIHQAISTKSEKRRHYRLSLHLPMEYAFPESSRLRLSYMVDICEDGLLMYTPENLEIGQNLRVKFYYDSAAGMDCIQALGKVVRVDRSGKSGEEFMCAVRFFDLSSEILKKLRKFLKSLY
jgi:c-di-GMP-binding flagellar brake protein YcgR